MARYVSQNNPVTARALKRRPNGSVVTRHYGRVDVKFTRVNGGWLRSRTDVTSENPVVVSSAAVAAECNCATGCRESWARIF